LEKTKRPLEGSLKKRRANKTRRKKKKNGAKSRILNGRNQKLLAVSGGERKGTGSFTGDEKCHTNIMKKAKTQHKKLFPR